MGPPAKHVVLAFQLAIEDEAKLRDLTPGFLQDQHGNPEGMFEQSLDDRLQHVLSMLFMQAVNGTTEQTGIHAYGGSVFIRDEQPDGSVEGLHIPGIPPLP